MTVLLYDREIEVVKSGNFLIPTSFPDLASIQTWLPQLEEWLDSGSPALKATPWIVGSGTHDIDGGERNSTSHQQGRAIDITPMWSNEHILDPDGSIPGLAWNMMSLLALSTIQSRTISWVVESDHIHVSRSSGSDLLMPNSVIVANTLASCYPIASKLKQLPQAEKLIGKLYAFQVSETGVAYAELSKDSLNQFKTYVDGND